MHASSSATFQILTFLGSRGPEDDWKDGPRGGYERLAGDEECHVRYCMGAERAEGV